MALSDEVRKVLSKPEDLPQEFLDYLIQYAAVNPTPVGALRAPMIVSTGTAGATKATRWVGSTTSGSPVSGYGVVGDFITTQDATIWICTVAGSPGTWVEVGGIPSSSAVLPGTSVNRSVTSQVIANSTATNISFDTVLFDDLGWFDPLNPTKITPTIDGQFLVTYTNAWVYPAGGGFPIQTGIGHTTPATVTVSEQVSAVAGTPNATSGPGIVNASAGDTFFIFVFQGSGGNMNTWIAGSSGTDIQPIPTLSVIRIGDRV